MVLRCQSDGPFVIGIGGASSGRDTGRAMSREDIGLARQYVETFNAHGVAGARHLRHPEIELYDPPDFPDAGRYVGDSALQERVESYIAIGWDGVFRSPEYIDAGEEVVVIFRAIGRGTIGGVPLDTAFGHLYLFEAGLLRRVRQYLSREATLEAAGLRE